MNQIEQAASRSTRDRLMDAAEELFAENGLQGPSLRDITAKAGANLSAVNYHFHSKEELVKALFARRLTPLNEERLRLLSEAEARAAGKPVPLEDILYAFIAPTVWLQRDHAQFMRAFGWLHSEPNINLHAFFMEQFEKLIARLKETLGRSVPDVPLEELFWRMYFIVGAMTFSWTNCADLGQLSHGCCRLDDYEGIIKRLVSFGAAGIRAGGRDNRA